MRKNDMPFNSQAMLCIHRRLARMTISLMGCNAPVSLFECLAAEGGEVLRQFFVQLPSGND